jgi:Zn-dependent protease with chaperone function
MVVKYYFLLIGLVLLLVIDISHPSICFSEVEIDRPVKKEVEKRILDKEIIIVPQLNKITTGFGRGKSGEFYFIKTLNTLFFQDRNVTVKVTDISFEDDGVIFGLWNDTLGEGKIRIFFSEQGSPTLSADEIEEALKFSLAFEKNQQVVVNTNSKVFHLHTCNHLPESKDSEEMKMTEALSKGNKPCGYCFVKLIYMPEFRLERQLAIQGAAALRYTNPLVVDQSVQEYIQEVGNRVMNKWPLPFIGYKYRFQVVESNAPNAFALPGGHVMVSSALLNSVENEEELEAVLAHEIAHVERRHILRSYYLAIEEQQTRQALAALAGAVAGAAVASNNRNQSIAITAGAIGVALVGMKAIDVYYSGYHKDHEREADDLAILYFEQNSMDKKNLENVFRKFEYLNLATVYNPDPSSLTHPYLEERIARVRQNEFQIFNNKHFIYTASNRASVQLDLLYQHILGKNSSISVYINDYDLIAENHYVYLTIKDEKGSKVFALDNEYIVRDTWGAYLLFESRDSDVVSKDVEYVTLETKNETETTDITQIMVPPPKLYNSYNFKEGVITFQ